MFQETESNNNGGKQYMNSIDLPQVMDDQNSQIIQPITVK